MPSQDNIGVPVMLEEDDEVEALQHRMRAMKSAYRLSPEFDSRAEWKKIAGRELSAVDEETLAHFNQAVQPGEDA